MLSRQVPLDTAPSHVAPTYASRGMTDLEAPVEAETKVAS
jgi:hypothetical protein